MGWLRRTTPSAPWKPPPANEWSGPPAASAWAASAASHAAESIFPIRARTGGKPSSGASASAALQPTWHRPNRPILVLLPFRTPYCWSLFGQGLGRPPHTGLQFQPPLQNLSQGLAAAHDARFYRAERYIQHRRYILITQIFYIAQHHRRPELRIHLFQSVLHQSARLA